MATFSPPLSSSSSFLIDWYICLFVVLSLLTFQYVFTACLLLMKAFTKQPRAHSDSMTATSERYARPTLIAIATSFSVSDSNFMPAFSLSWPLSLFLLSGGEVPWQASLFWFFITSHQDSIVLFYILALPYTLMVSANNANNSPYVCYFINTIWAMEKDSGCRKSQELRYHGYI